MRKHRPLDLHTVQHPTCQKCGRDLRKGTLDDGICTTIVSAVDKAPVRCVGAWAFEKIHFLTRYFDIFGAGMYKRWQGNIHYIEICSGPGRCVIRETAEEIDGTALAVIHQGSFPLYKSVTFFDRSEAVVDALNQRISALGQHPKAMAIKADYTDLEHLLNSCRERAPNGLVLIFLDPTDCSIPMRTVWALSQSLKNVDFIINVATGTDANRNLKQAFAKPDGNVRKKYETFLGSTSFFTGAANIQLAEANQDDKLRTQFRTAYQAALGEQSYQYFEVEIIRHYYDLLFASKHPTGLRFWQQAQRIRPDNQATFDLGM